MVLDFGFGDSARCEFLQFQLDLSKRMEKSNVKLIEDQKKVIDGQEKDILQLKKSAERLEKSLYKSEVKSELYFNCAAQFSEKFELLKELKARSDTNFKELQKKNNLLSREILALKATLQFTNMGLDIYRDQIEELEDELQRAGIDTVEPFEEFKNFPESLMDQFAKLKIEPENGETLEDELFQKELAKRMTCKICLSDVERLRCSQCLKGVCRDCHKKVQVSNNTGEKKCPHCRSDDQRFEPIIMTRL